MPRGLVTAIRTLTIFPSPGRDAEDLARAIPWFPLVGCLVGLLLWAVGAGFNLVSGGWSAGAAVAVTAGGLLITRGLHLDGLADWADGFGASKDKERALEIMKDPRIGAFGAAAIVLALMARWAACSRLIETGALSWIVPACIVSRTAMAELACRLPYARAENGSGAAPFVNQARPSHRLKALLLALLLVSAGSGLAGTLLFIGGWIFCRLLEIWFRKRVGGVTGDLLGACNEMVEIAILFVCAAGGEFLTRLIPFGVLSP